MAEYRRQVQMGRLYHDRTLVPHLKSEKISINEYTSPKALCKDIADFIMEYNSKGKYHSRDQQKIQPQVGGL